MSMPTPSPRAPHAPPIPTPPTQHTPSPPGPGGSRADLFAPQGHLGQGRYAAGPTATRSGPARACSRPGAGRQAIQGLPAAAGPGPCCAVVHGHHGVKRGRPRRSGSGGSGHRVHRPSGTGWAAAGRGARLAGLQQQGWLRLRSQGRCVHVVHLAPGFGAGAPGQQHRNQAGLAGPKVLSRPPGNRAAGGRGWGGVGAQGCRLTRVEDRRRVGGRVKAC